MYKFRVVADHRGPRRVGLALAAIGLAGLVGCSSGTSTTKPQVGAIAFTDVNATVQKPLPALTVNQGTYLDVTLTSDPKLLGADWSVSCGSALPPGTPLPIGQTQDQSCGTFTPGHTLSAPVPSYAAGTAGYLTFYTAPAVPPKQGIVTLYASATSDPTRFASITFAINGLPIAVGFAPAPPSSLGLSVATEFKAVLENDAGAAGVSWTALCNSADCGSFNPKQTASGVVTTYTSPATVPVGGAVVVTATSIADPTKSSSATIQILPVSVSVTPAVLTVPTAGTGTLRASVANDGTNKGVDWSVSCTNAVTPGTCGTITPHTGSNVTATYSAPSISLIAIGSVVTITATSTADPAKSAAASVTTVQGALVNGTVQAARQPVRRAQVTLYAAMSSAAGGAADRAGGSGLLPETALPPVAVTDGEGNFSIPYGYECPSAETQMYLVAAGGGADGGTNARLSLMTALGSCAKLDTVHVTLNEATTVAAVYALSGLMSDVEHVGSGSTPAAGVTLAFKTAQDLVDVTTGIARQRTVSGAGIVPEAKIEQLADLLSQCAASDATMRDEGNPCAELPGAIRPDTTPPARPKNTIEVLLDLARRGNGAAGDQALAARGALVSEGDWTLAIEFPVQGNADRAAAEARSPASLAAESSGSAFIDLAGNVWLRGSNGQDVEFVGAASSAGAPEALVPLAAHRGRAQ